MRQAYALTGAPCCGKTTLLNALGEKGFQTVPEAARIVIEREQANQSSCLPWIDRDSFQREVMNEQQKLEANLSGKAFLDRSMYDGIAYYLLDGLVPPEELLTAAQNAHYTRTFLLERNPHYECDNARKEDQDTAKRIEQHLQEVYAQFGHTLIRLPFSSVDQRIETILANI